VAPWHTMKRPLYDIIIRSSGFNPEPAGFEPNPPVDKAFPPLASLPFSLSLSLSLSFPLFPFSLSLLQFPIKYLLLFFCLEENHVIFFSPSFSSEAFLLDCVMNQTRPVA